MQSENGMWSEDRAYRSQLEVDSRGEKTREGNLENPVGKNCISSLLHWLLAVNCGLSAVSFHQNTKPKILANAQEIDKMS